MLKKINHQAGSVPLLILAAVVGLIGFLAISNTFSFKDNLFSSLYKKPSSNAQEAISSDIESLTNQLLAQNNTILQASPETNLPIAGQLGVDDMVSIAKTRNDLLSQEIETNPKAFLQHARLADQRSNFPTDIQTYIEENFDTEQYLVLMHYDNNETGTSKSQYHLADSDLSNSTDVPLETLSSLYIAENDPELSTGTRVKVKGKKINKKAAVADGLNQTSLKVTRSKSNKPSDKKVAVVLIKFPDSNVTINADTIKQWWFSLTNSVKKFYEDSSYNSFNVSGDIFGWFTASGVIASDKSCNYSAWIKSINNQIITQGINLKNYTNVQYIWFDAKDCGNNGWAALGGKDSYINGLNTAYAIQYPLKNPIHEFGHNLGLGHANFVGIEYGDPYDVMGTKESMALFNGRHRNFLEWVDNNKVQKVTASGTYTIYSLNIKDTSPKLLQIGSLYLEYRQPVGFDSQLLPQYTQGVSLRTSKKGVVTSLIDATPADGTNNNDPALKDGLSYNGKDFNIKQISHDANSAVVAVTLGSYPYVKPAFILSCKLGDVAIDGLINSVDTGYIQDYLDGLRVLDNDRLKRSDVNADGRVDPEDVTLLNQFIAQQITILPGCVVSE